ncbi:MAG: hypothetical protein AAF354_07370 [Pseudomonadota bacterium]
MTHQQPKPLPPSAREMRGWLRRMNRSPLLTTDQVPFVIREALMDGGLIDFCEGPDMFVLVTTDAGRAALQEIDDD